MTNPLNFGQVAIDAADAGALAGSISDGSSGPSETMPAPDSATIPGDRSFPTIIFLKVPEERAGKNDKYVTGSSNNNTAYHQIAGGCPTA